MNKTENVFWCFIDQIKRRVKFVGFENTHNSPIRLQIIVLMQCTHKWATDAELQQFPNFIRILASNSFLAKKRSTYILEVFSSTGLERRSGNSLLFMSLKCDFSLNMTVKRDTHKAEYVYLFCQKWFCHLFCRQKVIPSSQSRSTRA